MPAGFRLWRTEGAGAESGPGSGAGLEAVDVFHVKLRLVETASDPTVLALAIRVGGMLTGLIRRFSC